jgi:hypothetical protein
VQTYKVWVTNANSCVDSATINVYFSFSACTGVSDTKGQPEFYIYPNPAEGSVSVVIDPAHPPVLFEVYSVYGSKVMSVELNGGQGSRLQQVVDISSLSRGLYILKVSGSDLSASRKLLVR